MEAKHRGAASLGLQAFATVMFGIHYGLLDAWIFLASTKIPSMRSRRIF